VRLFVARHGQTAWNLEGRAQGHTDVPLDAVGLEQAGAVAEALRGRVRVVWSSDLSRAAQTAERIAAATGARVVTLPALRERNMGEWEGQPYADVRAWLAERARAEGLDLVDVRPAGGESVRDHWERTASVLAEIEEVSCDAAVVAHGGSCGLLLGWLLRGTLDTTRSFRFGNGALTELSRRPDGFWTLVRYADESHLAAPSAPMVDGHAQAAS
jgi:broad specificity phosphatase PhoE